ncbi:hypothetical protein GCM10025776_10140 [Corallincola platygyrae]
MSDKRLGERKQSERFSFQAQIGAGVYFGKDLNWLASISYKHFSNANLFNENDGFDVPIVLTIGRRW